MSPSASSPHSDPKRYNKPEDVGPEKTLKAFLENARAKKDARNKNR